MVENFKKIKTLVIGDFMLDRYTTGIVERISPEAPVPVVKVENISNSPGGAGNVVVNLLSLNAEVIAMGRIGEDGDGKILLEDLKKMGADVENIFYQKRYPTPLKNRLIAISQQIARIDREDIQPICEELEEKIIQRLPNILKNIQVVAVSDYDKGFLSKKILKEVIRLSKERDIPCIIDPKGLDFSKYRDACFIKPNQMEAYLASNMPLQKSLEEVAKQLIDITNTDNLIITRSQDGITVFDKNRNRRDFPVISKEVKDVTGAGDTVLASLAVCIGNKVSLDQAIMIANISAGIAIEHIGCVRVGITDILERWKEVKRGRIIFQ